MRRFSELLRALISAAWRRPLRTIGCLILVAIVTLFSAMVWMDYCGRCELTAAIAETDREWPGWRLEEILKTRPNIPDDENSAKWIERIVGDSQTSDEVNQVYTEIYDHATDDNHRLSDALLSRAKTALAPYRAKIDELTKLKDFRRGCWYTQPEENWIGTVYEFQNIIGRSRGLLEAEIELLAHERMTSRAVECILAMIQGAESLKHERMGPIPCLMHLQEQKRCLVRTERLLALTELSDDQVSLLTDGIKTFSADNDLSRSFAEERAGNFQLFEFFKKYGFNNQPNADTSILPDRRIGFLVEWWLWPYLADDQAYQLRYCNACMRRLSLPPHQQREAMDAIMDQIETDVGNSRFRQRLPVSRFNSANYGFAADRYHEHQAWLLCCGLGLAAERYRLVHHRFPRDLAELHSFDSTLDSIDPFSGKQVLWKTDAAGVTIYSIGRDRKDDLGVRKPTHEDHGDIGFRLWNPDQRGLPPLPEVNSTEVDSWR